MMSDILSDYIEVWGFENNNVIFSDGSFGFGFDLRPLDISTYSAVERESLSLQITQFLNGLPEFIDIQFLQEVTRGNSTILNRHSSLTNPSCTMLVQTLTQGRKSRLSEADEAGLLPSQKIKVYVRYKASKQIKKGLNIFKPPEKFQAMTQEYLNNEVIMVERIKLNLYSALSRLVGPVMDMGAQDLMNDIYMLWNPCRKISVNDSFDVEYVREHLALSDVSIYERGFSIGDVHHRVLSLKLLPDQTYSAMIEALTALPFQSRVLLSIHLPNQVKELANLEGQRRLAFSLASSKRGGMADFDSEAKLADVEDILEKMVKSGEKVFYASLNIILRSESIESLQSQVNEALMKIRTLGGAEGMEETIAAFDIFSQSATPNARCAERKKRMKTSNLADLVPIYGEWRGHEEPRILLRSRKGSLVAFDPFSSELTNYNQIISGGSGSGKSFLCSLLLMQMMKELPKIFIIDIGGSYKKICETFNGEYIMLSPGSGISINPFDLTPGEKKPSDQKIKLLLGLVEIMTKETEANSLGKLERSLLEESIMKVYEDHELPRLTHLMNALISHTSPEMQKLGKILKMWCGDTPYGKFLDTPTQINLENSLISFDLKGLGNYPDLQSVCLFVLTDLIWRAVQKDQTSMKFLLLDECWKLIENDTGSIFIAEIFRTFRKYRASCIAISQNIDDFAASKISTAILSNAATKWILKQKGAKQERLKEVLQLNDTEMALVESIEQVKGSYSEAFLMAGDHKSLIQVESTPLEYWLATTDPKDIQLSEKTQMENPGLKDFDLFTLLAARYPNGAFGPKES